MGRLIRNGKSRKGFTMIEVILFLAVSSIMLTAFMVTISGRIGNQRYNDATNSFVDFLRSVYSKAINVQN
ncbi:type II secretion system protein, partial [Candidatus Saccharibacteria bacterium]|nr:type II secretion system protein [Candidatus Saccharibacteria bacterium]